MKIVLTGPESSGKTTLASWISAKYNIRLVPELARDYFHLQTNGYSENSVREIALLQLWEERYACENYQKIVCDTDLLTILIWQQEKFGQFDSDLFLLWLNSREVMYYLCIPDIPWQYDPLRENEHDRDRLLKIYDDMLTRYSKKFIRISGDLESRQHQIARSIHAFLNPT